jgi:hypothetical protein
VVLACCSVTCCVSQLTKHRASSGGKFGNTDTNHEPLVLAGVWPGLNEQHYDYMVGDAQVLY